MQLTGFSVTHQHAGPAGYFQYMLFDVMSLGFVNATFEAIVSGVVQAISEAEESLVPAQLSFGSAEVDDGGYNRSPTSYLRNPEEERALYTSDHETSMQVLKLSRVPRLGGQSFGMFSFYPVRSRCTLSIRAR